MDNGLKQRLTKRSTWLRAIYMLLFVVIFWVAEVVITAIVVLQFILTLFSGSSNRQLLEFGKDISIYIYQILSFLTFNSEDLPFPFTSWPHGQEVKAGTKSSVKKSTGKKTTKKKSS